MSDSFTAKLHNFNVAPRKARLVANLVRGRRVTTALSILRFSDKKTAPAIYKLLQSAVNNVSKAATVSKDDLIVKAIKVDKGRTMRRFVPRARGRTSIIRRRKSHITLTLQE